MTTPTHVTVQTAHGPLTGDWTPVHTSRVRRWWARRRGHLIVTGRLTAASGLTVDFLQRP